MHISNRRLRQAQWIRDLVAETKIDNTDFIQPLFMLDGKKQKQEIDGLHGIHRLSKDLIIEEIKKARDLGIKMVALFPCIEAEHKTPNGDFALDRRNNFLYKAIEDIKKAVPDVGLMVDVALDPYTTTGHDGILDNNGRVCNQLTVEALSNLSVLLAASGVDVVAPSDMMDGRVFAIREMLLDNGFEYTIIASYSVKYASAFYGPFRNAVGSNKAGYLDKKTYQLDYRNSQEAIKEAIEDELEGADMLIIKPGIVYLDILKETCKKVHIPVFGYQVSGEYAMLKTAAEKGLLEYDRAIMETMIAFKRAGASGIITYAAMDIAKRLL